MPKLTSAGRRVERRDAGPDFQTLMRPLMEEYATGGERPIADVRAALAVKLQLSEEDLAERIERACGPSTTASAGRPRTSDDAAYSNKHGGRLQDHGPRAAGARREPGPDRLACCPSSRTRSAFGR